MAAVRKYDLYSDRFRAETYSSFAEMRERDPVLCRIGLDGQSPIWFISCTPRGGDRAHDVAPSPAALAAHGRR